MWSVVVVEVDVNSATYDMVDQCGADGKSKLDLVTTHTMSL